MRKSFYFVPVIFLLSFLIVGCGGGGGGGTSPSPAPTVICNSPAGAANQMPVCYTGSEGAINISYVTVYINNKPFNLLLDTGATGILVNQSALQAAGINMAANSNTFSGSFADGTTFGGFVNGAQVSTMASGGLSTSSNFPIAVNTSGNAFPSSGFLQGDCGMGLSNFFSFGLSGGGTMATPSFVQGLTTDNNGFVMSLPPNLNTDGYSYSGSGQLTFGLTSGNTSGFTFFPNDPVQSQSFPVLDSEFGGLSNNPAGRPYTSVLDTGSNFIFMENSAIANALGMGEGALSQIEYNLSSNTPLVGSTTLIKGGKSLSVGFYTGSGFDNSAGFTTSPNDSGVNFEFPQSVFTGVPSGGYLLIGDIITPQSDGGGQQLMGLPYLFSPQMFWQVSPYGIGIQIP